jgi:peptidoglycan-associated lipoprotein
VNVERKLLESRPRAVAPHDRSLNLWGAALLAAAATSWSVGACHRAPQSSNIEFVALQDAETLASPRGEAPSTTDPTPVPAAPRPTPIDISEADVPVAAQRAPLPAPVNRAFTIARVFDSLYFDPDSAELRFDSRRSLRECAQWLTEHPEVWMTLVGHDGPTASTEFGFTLAMERALRGREHLISLGVARDRLFTLSYGEELPLETEAAPTDRRIELLAFYAPPDGELPGEDVDFPPPPAVVAPPPAPPGVDIP